MTAPTTVRVLGRRGVGRSGVAAGLRACGVPVESEQAGAAEVTVVVIAETLKPEDRVAVAAHRADVVVLNKADLGGAAPIRAATAYCAEVSRRTGVTTVPMVAHLATVDLDDELMGGLRVLAGLVSSTRRSVDGFVADPHPLSESLRARLLDALDLAGIAHAIAACRARPGIGADELGMALRAASGAAQLRDVLTPLLAERRYDRIRLAVAALRRHGALHPTAATAIAAFLDSEEVVVARMAAAADSLPAAPPPAGHGPLQLARRWRRIGATPLRRPHRDAAADLTRGALRVWQLTGEPR